MSKDVPIDLLETQSEIYEGRINTVFTSLKRQMVLDASYGILNALQLDQILQDLNSFKNLANFRGTVNFNSFVFSEI